MPYRIDDDLKAYIESGVVTMMGTADGEGRPHVVPVWGPRVQDGGRALAVFLETPRAARALEDLRANPWVAVTFGDPVSYRSVQVKGPSRSIEAASDDDRDWVRQQREAVMANLALVGDPLEVIRNLWMEADLLRIEFETERAFNQTPGPGAGAPL